MANQRSSFRIDENLDAELHYRGRVHPCQIVNLSAGGARIRTQIELTRERTCMVEVPLPKELARSAGRAVVQLHLEVLDSTPDDQQFVTRMRSLDAPGSPEQEATAKLVFALQRRARAAQSGAEDASPMQTTAESIRRERSRAKLRISRALWNPLRRRDGDD